MVLRNRQAAVLAELREKHSEKTDGSPSKDVLSVLCEYTSPWESSRTN